MKTHTIKVPSLDEWMNYLAVKGLSYGTIEQYCIRFRIFPHTKLSQETVNVYLTEHTGQVNRSFVKNYLEFIRNKDIIIPKKTGRKKIRVPETVSQEHLEIIRFAMYELNELYGIMFDLEYQGGLRREELVELKINSFEWDNWIKDKSKPCRLHVIGKGDKERIVIISTELATKITDYYREKLKSGKLRFTDKMFKIGKRRWWEILKVVSEKIIERRIKPHMLRRSRATDLWNTGKFDLMDIKNFLGHTDISTTQLYISPDKEKSLKKFEESIEEEQITHT